MITQYNVQRREKATAVYAESKSPDQPAQMHSLIMAFLAHWRKSLKYYDDQVRLIEKEACESRVERFIIRICHKGLFLTVHPDNVQAYIHFR